ARPLDCGISDGGSDRLLDLGVGHRYRQDTVVRTAAAGRGPILGSGLVRAIAGRFLQNAWDAARAIYPRAIFCPPARKEAQPRRSRPFLGRTTDAYRESHGRRHRPRGRTHGTTIAGAGDGRLGWTLYWPVRHGGGHHDELSVDRCVAEHLARRSRTGDRR